MINLEDLPARDYFLEINESFRNEIKDKVLKKYGSLRQFEIQTRIVSGPYLGEIFRENGFTNVDKWIRICGALNIDIDALKTNIVKIRLKTLNSCFLTMKQFPINPSKELASLVGHALGDGHINYKHSYLEYSNNSYELQEEVLHFIKILFNWTHYTEKFHKATTRTYNKVIGDILILSGAIGGNKIIKKFEIPEWIMEGSDEIKKSFVRAMFDDESTVKVSGKEILFKLSKNENYINSLYLFMNQLRKIIEELGIEVTSIKRGNILTGKNGRTIQLILGIHGYDNFVKYKNIVGFTSNEKTQDINDLLNSYQKFKLKSGRGQRLIYENLVQPTNIYSLMSQLNMNYMAVYKHLSKLRNKGLIEKIEHSRTEPAVWRRIK